MTLRKSLALLLAAVVLCACAPWDAASPASLAGVDGCCPADARAGDPCAARAGADDAPPAGTPAGTTPACALCDCCAPQRVAPAPPVALAPVCDAIGRVEPEAASYRSTDPPRDVFHPPRLPAA